MHLKHGRARGGVATLAAKGMPMRLPTIAPMLLLAPAPPLVAFDAGDAGLHTLCGDDTIASSVERILPDYGAGAPTIAAKPQAQAFFDNGLQLSHAFANATGQGAFKEAARLDPECAMCL